jgi:trigger factor
LNIEKQITEDHHAKLTVQVDADQLESMKRRAASKLARRVKIPGFRPGKAPYPVIVRQLGEAAILEEAIELLVEEIYPEVIKDAEIEPYGPGKLENISEKEPLTLEFSIPLEAETVLGDYHSIKREYAPEAVSDQDVADVVQDLRERNAIIEPVDRPAQIGDLVSLKLSATRSGTENEPAEVLIPERPTSVIIRPVVPKTQQSEETTETTDDGPNEWPFPGFSQRLIGLAVGDEKSFEYTFPADADYTTLQGAEAQFQVKVEAVKSRQLPELDDEFVKMIGEFDSLDDLQAEIRKTLEAQKRTAYNDEYDTNILDAAIEQTTFKYPPEMVEREIETVISEFGRRLERQGMDLDLYLKTRSIDMQGFKEEVKPVAEGRIKRALFLVEFGKAENIEVKPEELENEAYSTMNYLYNTLPERDARKLSDRDVYTNIVGNLLADMLSHRSLAHFRELCSGGLSKEEVNGESESENETLKENAPVEHQEIAETVESGTPPLPIPEDDPVGESTANDSQIE